MRVFLHDLMWSDSPERFLKTADRFLDIAQKHDIGILFVIFDSCWTAYPMLGPQPEPTPYVHNSQWVQSPGVDIVNSEEDFLLLESYVTGVLTHFKDDHRVIGWDLWNEPDNSGYTPDHIASLLAHVFDWARAVSPSQPLTSCLWKGGRWGNFEQLSSLEKLCVTESDVISFHHYGDVEDLSAWTESLLGYGEQPRDHVMSLLQCKYKDNSGVCYVLIHQVVWIICKFRACTDKPVMCTEYMARGQNSTFNPNLGYFKEEHISAFSWGVVSGKTQTIYPWDSSETPNPYAGQDDPQPWFHDIFRSDGTARYPEEADYIKSLTGVSTV